MFVQGFILINVEGAALNNTGVVSRSGIENTVETKKINKEGCVHTYASGEAWGNWWRTTLGKTGWQLSPVTYDTKNRVAYTAADPIKYNDDDIFGYMKAVKNEAGKKGKKDNKSEDVVDQSSETENDSESLSRISPLKTSTIMSVGNVRVARNFCVMARQNDVPAPYGKEEYSAIMKGMFSLDMEQVGTFSKYNRAGYKNITESTFEENKDKGNFSIIEDGNTLDKHKKPEHLLRMSNDIRIKRIRETIKALKHISGGAMQTNNMAETTPKFIVLAVTKYGNHPFSEIVFADPIRKEQSVFDINKFINTINDCAEDFEGDIFIGRRDGFWEEYAEALEDKFGTKLGAGKKGNDTDSTNSDKDVKSKIRIHYGRVNKIIDDFCDTINLVK